MTTTLFLVRHAHHDPRGRFLQHACEGLTSAGVHQARDLARTIKELVAQDNVALLASRATRAIQTADAVAAELGTFVAEHTCDLCEMHPGEAEGMTYEEMAKVFGPNYSFVPGAEYFPDWLPRGISGLERIVNDYADRDIVAVTHTGVIRASFITFGGLTSADVERMTFANAEITRWNRPSPSSPTSRS